MGPSGQQELVITAGWTVLVDLPKEHEEACSKLPEVSLYGQLVSPLELTRQKLIKRAPRFNGCLETQ